MELRIRTCRELADTLASGLVTNEEWAGYLDGLGERPADVAGLTLDEFGRLSEAANDIATVQTWRAIKGLPPLTEADGANEFVHELAAIRGGVRMVEQAFAKIPRPSLSAAERAAGYGGNDGFGLFGLVDTLARRQGLTDEEAKKITVANAIGKLSIDGLAAARERRVMEIQAKRR